jgi:hypothetical protein
MLRRTLLVLSLITASTLIGTAWTTVAGATSSHPSGRYSGGESQNGNPLWLFVSANKTQVQDLVIQDVGLSCTGGFGTDRPIVIDAMNIQSDGSFSTDQTLKGDLGDANNTPATFTIILNGSFGTTSGTPDATGTFLETASYTLNGSSDSCTSGARTWHAARDTQPNQPAGVGTAGTYTLVEEQPNGGSFKVPASRTEMKNLTFNLVSMGCNPGDWSVGGTVALSPLALSSAGSFSTKFTGTLTGLSVPVNYTIKVKGHFHGVDSSGASRAAGSYVMKGSYTKDGTLYHCNSNKLWWTGSHS